MSSHAKIKRVQPLIRIKKTKVEEEAAALQVIRQEKVKIVASMKENQRRYLEGIEQLNRIRGSRDRDNIETLESAVDHVKGEWYRLYQDVQAIEHKEKLQFSQLLMAERELRSVEKLEERYRNERQREIARSEQKHLDDIAIRQFIDR